MTAMIFRCCYGRISLGTPYAAPTSERLTAKPEVESQIQLASALRGPLGPNDRQIPDALV
jgi:hypothetical protein